MYVYVYTLHSLLSLGEGPLGGSTQCLNQRKEILSHHGRGGLHPLQHLAQVGHIDVGSVFMYVCMYVRTGRGLHPLQHLAQVRHIDVGSVFMYVCVYVCMYVWKGWSSYSATPRTGRAH
jgi:hypothetical protein